MISNVITVAPLERIIII